MNTKGQPVGDDDIEGAIAGRADWSAHSCMDGHGTVPNEQNTQQ